jgi:predicted aspartyl protease
MSTFSVPIQVGDQAGRRYIDLEALVDTGSSHTAIPENILNQLGILPKGQRCHLLADNSAVVYPWSEARIRIRGKADNPLMATDISVVVVFMPVGSDPLLGASTLESFGAGIDTLAERLVVVDQLLK